MVYVRILSPVSLSVELAHSDRSAPEARFSDDGQALFVPVLRAAPNVLRRVVHGDSLYRQFVGSVLVESRGGGEHTSIRRWSYVWGDLRLFRNGEPVIDRCIFIAGVYTRPDLRQVRRYLQEFQNAPAPRLSAREEIMHVPDPV